MVIKLVREGNRYRTEPEMAPSEMPETLFFDTPDQFQWPQKTEIWGAAFNPGLSAEMQKFLDETDENGNEI